MADESTEQGSHQSETNDEEQKQELQESIVNTVQTAEVQVETQTPNSYSLAQTTQNQPITCRSPAPVLLAYIREHGLEALESHLNGVGIRIRNDGMLDRRTVVGRALGRYEDEILAMEVSRIRSQRASFTLNSSQNRASVNGTDRTQTYHENSDLIN